MLSHRAAYFRKLQGVVEFEETEHRSCLFEM